MSIRLTRKELYDRVWAEPMQTLSRELGLSDVGLAKICRRHGVPVPARGYWAKKRVGKAPAAPELPAATSSKNVSDRFTFPGKSERRSAEQVGVRPPEPHPLVLAEDDSANVIDVPDGLAIRHPLLTATKEAWRRRRSPDYPWHAPRPEHLHIDVDKASQHRALRLLQALFAALERRGHSVSRAEHGRIQVKVLEDVCEMSLRERLRQTRTPPSNDPYRRPYELTPTGQLEFRIELPFNRVTVRDTPELALEQRLNMRPGRRSHGRKTAGLGQGATREANDVVSVR